MTGLKISHVSIEETTFKEVSAVGEEFDKATIDAFEILCDRLQNCCPSVESWRINNYPTRQETMDWVFGKPIKVSTVIKRRTIKKQ